MARGFFSRMKKEVSGEERSLNFGSRRGKKVE